MTTSEDAAAAGPPRPPRDTQQMYLDVRHKPLTVHAVEVKGDERTRPGLFARVLAPVYRAGTLDELRVRCLEANAVLSSYGIFDRVDILCDAGPEEHPDTADVVVEVVEKKKLNLKGGAYVSQSGEGSMEMSAGLNNALGFAEKLDVEMIRGHERSSTCVLAWNQPRVWNRDVDVVTRAFQQVSCSKRLSSFDETARGVSVTAVGGGPAQIEYVLAVRDIADPTRLASRAIRHQLGPSLKSSIAYTIAVDERDRPTRPTRGYLYRLRSELRGHRRGPTDDAVFQAGGGGARRRAARRRRRPRRRRQARRARPARTRGEERSARDVRVRPFFLGGWVRSAGSSRTAPGRRTSVGRRRASTSRAPRGRRPETRSAAISSPSRSRPCRWNPRGRN